jgi:hypothetical protein
MDIISKKNSDLINDLPTDKNQPTHSELKVINSLFKESPKKEGAFMKCLSSIIQYIFLTLLIMLVYFIPNDSVKKIIPSIVSENEIFIIFIKAIVASFVYYLFQNYFYRKKRNNKKE